MDKPVDDKSVEEKSNVNPTERTAPKASVIPLSQHNEGKEYRALNGEWWPTLVASHARLGNGQLVHLSSYIGEQLGKLRRCITETHNDAVDALDNHKGAINDLRDDVADLTKQIKVLKTDVRLLESEIESKDNVASALRSEVDRLRAEVDRAVRSVCATPPRKK